MEESAVDVWTYEWMNGQKDRQTDRQVGRHANNSRQRDTDTNFFL